MLKVFDRKYNWWYYYYSVGYGRGFTYHPPAWFFCLNKWRPRWKLTPEFSNYKYRSCICHPQIGSSLKQLKKSGDNPEGKSIILVTTSVGSPPERYIVGFFRVAHLGYSSLECNNCPKKKFKDRCKKYGSLVLYMDERESMLLFDDAIRVDNEIAEKLFPDYEWKALSKRQVVRKIGSFTRNSHVSRSQIEFVTHTLDSRYKKGVRNYIGKEYRAGKEHPFRF